MSIPQRAQMKLVILPGLWSCVGFALFILGMASFASSGMGKGMPELMLLLCMAVLLTPFWVGLYLDTRKRRAKLRRALEAQGLVFVERGELDPALTNMGAKLKPTPLKPESFKLSLTGDVGGHEVVISRHTVGHGKYKQHLTSCAVWTPLELPKMTVRPKRLRSKIKSTPVLADERFNKQREVICDDPDRARALLSALSAWFVMDKQKAMSFSISVTPGLREEWLFEDHWVMLVERGRSTPDALLKMAHFVTSFVRMLEAQALKSESAEPFVTSSREPLPIIKKPLPNGRGSFGS